MNATDKVIYRNALICAAIACLLGAIVYFLFLKDLPFYAFNGVPVPPESTDFVGHWEGDNTELVVRKEGRVYFRHQRGNFEEKLDMPLQSISLDAISMGMAFWKTDIAVQVPPHAENGKWHMTAEHVDLTRKE